MKSNLYCSPIFYKLINILRILIIKTTKFIEQFLKFFAFSAFPKGCVNYNSPHMITCLQTLWGSAGCTKDGYLFPTVLDELDSADQDMNLRYVKE